MNQGKEFELIAKTFQGLEELLAGELTALGANNIEIGRRMVSFTGDKYMMYKANFCLRTAIRILKPIIHFRAFNADDVYAKVKEIKWEDYLDPNTSFAVDAVVFSNEFHHSKFVAYKVKDAIVDYFVEKEGKRPSVKISNPDIQLNIHIAETTCTLSLDSSGESLHRRGYRQDTLEAPLNEVLAAGMIMMTGWNGQCDFIDPMCGSGTLPIEAALIARNIAPGVFRKGYAFEKWRDFDREMFEEIYNDDSQERDFNHKIYGFDNSPKAVAIAKMNVKAAGVTKDVEIALRPMQEFSWNGSKAVMVTNPPYGERLNPADLADLYKCIGERLKKQFTGNDAWILSYKDECFDNIGLKSSENIPLFNGALECKFKKYSMFDGRYKEYKTGLSERKREGKDDGSRSSESGKPEFKRRRPEGKPSFRQDERKGKTSESRGRDAGKPASREEKFSGKGDKPFSRERRHSDSRADKDTRKERSFGKRGNDKPKRNNR